MPYRPLHELLKRGRKPLVPTTDEELLDWLREKASNGNDPDTNACDRLVSMFERLAGEANRGRLLSLSASAGIPATASELIDWLRSRADGHDVDTDLFEQAAAMIERLSQGLNSDLEKPHG